MNVRSVCRRFVKLRRSLLECKQQSWSCSQTLRLSVPRNLQYVKWLTAWLARQGYANALRLVIFSTSINAKMLETKRFPWRRDCLILDKVLQSYLFLRLVFELTVSDRVIFFWQHRYTQAKLNIADRANKVGFLWFVLALRIFSFCFASQPTTWTLF